MARTGEELYRQSKKGNRQAFAELYERYAPALYRYGLHLSGSPAIAEEVTHELFLQLIGPYAGFDEQRGSLEAYLYGAVRNLVRVAWRNRSFAQSENQAAEDDLLGDLIRDERTAALYAAIRELPPQYRDAVMLCELEERSYEDAARILGCPIGTVRSRLHRARMLLAARMKPAVVSSPAVRR
jgi:RNA polymerase sigma-70 factor (ECF subfamily)